MAESLRGGAIQDEHSATWKYLFLRQKRLLEGKANEYWLRGLERLKLSADFVPNKTFLNGRLKRYGWKVYPVIDNVLTNDQLFITLSHKRFPIMAFLRKPADLTHSDRPDFFHEIFGHLPYLAVKETSELIELFSKVYAVTPLYYRAGVGRWWWHTMEWGYIRQKGQAKAFGAAILSTERELTFSFKKKKKLFSLKKNFLYQKEFDYMQENYFIFDSIRTLRSELSDYIEYVSTHSKLPFNVPSNFNLEDETGWFNNKLNSDR